MRIIVYKNKVAKIIKNFNRENLNNVILNLKFLENYDRKEKKKIIFPSLK